MIDPSRFNPTGRFAGLSDLYVRHRPGYPDAALDRIVQFAGLSGSSLLIDVGAGTGISSRLMAGRSVPVIGIEPNDEMRGKAAAELLPGDVPRPEYRAGRSEATGLSDGCADAVLAAQAFHWFDAAAALREFHRILKPGGTVALMWNERDEADPFTAAFGDVIRTAPDTAAVEGPRVRARRTAVAHAAFPRSGARAFRQQTGVGGRRRAGTSVLGFLCTARTRSGRGVCRGFAQGVR